VKSDLVTYRLPAATFPFRFKARDGRPWVLDLHFIQGASCWRAHVKRADDQRSASDGYYVQSGFNREDLSNRLTVRGVEMLRRSPVATLFRALESQRLAERIHPSANAS
jgi:hypothetical protein